MRKQIIAIILYTTCYVAIIIAPTVVWANPACTDPLAIAKDSTGGLITGVLMVSIVPALLIKFYKTAAALFLLGVATFIIRAYLTLFVGSCV